MRSISSIIIKLVALMTVLVLMPLQGLATTMDHTLTLGVISTKTTSLNPLVSQEREFQSLTALMYEGLYAIDDDYRPQKHLAEDCSVSNGGKTLTINIRSGVKFHNGKELTAYDVEATINEILRLANEGQGQYLQLKYFIASASANNGKTIIIKLNRAYYGNYYALTFPILPREEVQSTQPSGTGPYKLDRFVPKDYLYLSANENWWKEPPTVKNINVNFSATNKDLISDYEFNVLDAAITRSAAAGQYRTGLTNLNISYRTRQLETLLMCFNEFPLDDVRVRQAIRYAIDFDSIAASVYMGTAERTDTPIPSSIWLYNNAIQHEYNPDKARELLAQAGWVESLDDDNVLDQIVNGSKRRLRLRIYVYEEQGNSVRVQVANHISSYLTAVGFEAPVFVLSFEQTAEYLNAHNFDLCIASFQMDVVPDPGFLLTTYNTGNYGSYSSKSMDNLFKSFRAATDEFDFQQQLNHIQSLFWEDCPFICMYYRSGALLTRKVFTTVRDVREPEILRGIESIGN